MKNTNLNKDDLLCLVKGTGPYYSVFEHELVKRVGHWTGGFVEEWSWNSNLSDLSEDELWDLYVICKNSWPK